MVSVSALGQNAQQRYAELIAKANSLYNAKDFKNAALSYSEAFKVNGWKGTVIDRYNAACSWALSKNRDSAYFQLTRIATRGGYSDYDHLTSDVDLTSLHNDDRWNTLIQIVKKNKTTAEANLNKPLAARLDSIFEEDQKYRQQIREIEGKYGRDSKEMRNLYQVIIEKDSVNLLKVKEILDQHGWLGSDIVGAKGNSTLFLVIQHSDQSTQEKYLPMMRLAVKQGKADGSNLALLEDRVALGQGKKQTYGSQIARDQETKEYYVLPLDDPDNVDKRRAEVGLPPLSEYLIFWDLKWDVEQYKRDLPSILQKQKARRK